MLCNVPFNSIYFHYHYDLVHIYGFGLHLWMPPNNTWWWFYAGTIFERFSVLDVWKKLDPIGSEKKTGTFRKESIQDLSFVLNIQNWTTTFFFQNCCQPCKEFCWKMKLSFVLGQEHFICIIKTVLSYTIWLKSCCTSHRFDFPVVCRLIY